jgi:hypothetical protein
MVVATTAVNAVAVLPVVVPPPTPPRPMAVTSLRPKE